MRHVIVHNDALGNLLRDDYQAADVQKIRQVLEREKTLYFPRLATGLFPAANVTAATQYTGYDSVWVRDTAHIANAHRQSGDSQSAVIAASALMRYFQRQSERFVAIIAGNADPSDEMQRPHIRLNGNTLDDVRLSNGQVQHWSHAQNDALGYFLWLYCDLAKSGLIDPAPADVQMLAFFAQYLAAIEYWQDEDSGHWEETRKMSASSIGAVIAGLNMQRRLWIDRKLSLAAAGGGLVDETFLEELIANGRTVLNQILPAECIQSDHSKQRRYDAALLFLIEPLNVVSGGIAQQIVRDVIENLQGEVGIRRYIGDSFWSADYQDNVSPEHRTAGDADDLFWRDRLSKPGLEAQWCIFDPVLSTIYAKWFQATGRAEYLSAQVHHLNRSLGQITREQVLKRDSQTWTCPAWRCPELYYLEKENWAPNHATPLLWTQANLMVALECMEQSAIKDGDVAGSG